MIKIWIAREWRRWATGGLNEERVVGIRDLVDREQKFVNPDAMHRPLAVLTKRIKARGATHQELASWNCDKRGSAFVEGWRYEFRSFHASSAQRADNILNFILLEEPNAGDAGGSGGEAGGGIF